MDLAHLWSLVQDNIVPITFAFTVASTGASFLISITPTPPPGSSQARIYHWIELVALSFGYAKDHGLINPTPAMTAAAGEALQLGQDVVATFKGKSTVAPQQLGADASATAAALVAALKEAGLIKEPRPPKVPVAKAAAILAIAIVSPLFLVGCNASQKAAIGEILPIIENTAATLYPPLGPVLTDAAALACQIQANANALPPSPTASAISTQAGTACTW